MGNPDIATEQHPQYLQRVWSSRRALSALDHIACRYCGAAQSRCRIAHELSELRLCLLLQRREFLLVAFERQTCLSYCACVIARLPFTRSEND